jgi:hypothetical protein
MVGVNSSSGRLVDCSVVAAGVGTGKRRNLRHVRAGENRRRRDDRDRATTTDSTRPAVSSAEGEHFLCGDWSGPLESGTAAAIRGFMFLQAERDAAMGRCRLPARAPETRPAGSFEATKIGARRLRLAAP